MLNLPLDAPPRAFSVMRRIPRVALLIETSKAYGRGLLRGLGQYLRLHGPWSVYMEERGIHEPPPAWLDGWEGDGVVTRIDLGAAADFPARGVPVVNLRPQLPQMAYPAIFTDDRKIGELAADHFLERGFKRLAFVGLEGINWSESRGEAFSRRVHEAGGEVIQKRVPYPKNATASWESLQDELALWVASMPPPAGVFACYDELGLRILDACRRSGRAVPEETAVLGVDDDVELCSLTSPPLSSIAHDLERIGFEAGVLLDRMMKGEPAPAAPEIVPPRGVVVRESTDASAIADPDVARALRYIRWHACQDMGVDDVVRETHLSRRSLERRFRQVVGRSPLEEIVRVKLERAQRLLRETDYKLSRIASLSGFSDEDYLCSVFKRKLGCTPGDYRKKERV